MYETFDTPFYLQRSIEVHYTPFTAEWQISGKTAVGQNNVAAYSTYGTERANAYKILEDSLNLRDVRIYDTVEDADRQGAPGAERQGDYPCRAKAAGYSGGVQGLDLARPGAAAGIGAPVQRGDEQHPGPASMTAAILSLAA